MKKIKKFLSIILTVVMVLAMAAPAFAETPTTYTITINSNVTGHTYEAYQIFTGDLSSDGKVLSNIKWGTGVSAVGQQVLGDAVVKAESIKAESDAIAFAKLVEDYLTKVKAETSTLTDGAYVISGLTPGYYLVKDKDDSLTGYDAYTAYILKVVGNVDAAPKSDVPTSTKKVKDINDSTATASDWQDSADYDIGDKVPFQLTGTVAANYDKYDGAYKFIFHDEADNLTLDTSSVKVYVDNSTMPIEETYYVVKTTGICTDCDFEIVFEDLKKVESVVAGSVIRVEYLATLEDTADLGNDGNANTMYLEYSNNPNPIQGTDGTHDTGKTPEDTVKIFTYKVVLNKVAKNASGTFQPLTGAEFKLEKKTGDTWTDITTIKNDDGTTFTFSGLDDGQYRLTETTTPNGYNTIAPVYFEVSATHDTNATDPKVTELTATQTNEKYEALTEANITAKFTSELENGSLTTDIENRAGATLPSTGGIGTTIFYLAGIILMAGAVFFVIRSKRREN